MQRTNEKREIAEAAAQCSYMDEYDTELQALNNP